MSNLPNPQIYIFDGAEFEEWLVSGILTYIGAKHLPSYQRMPDAFEHAELFIGQNEHDLVEDLKDVYQALPPPTRVAFQRGVVHAWSNLVFLEDQMFDLADHLLGLACRVSAKMIVGSLEGVIAQLAAAADTDNRFKRACEVRKRAFQAALELSSSSTDSVLCIEAFVLDAHLPAPLLERGRSLEIVRYLARHARDRLAYWCAIFGNFIVSDIDAGMLTEQQARQQLERAYGEDKVQRVIDMVRIDKVGRLATERDALADASVQGLQNLVSRIDSANAGGGKSRSVVTLGWEDGQQQPVTLTAQLFNLDDYREMRGV